MTSQFQSKSWVTSLKPPPHNFIAEHNIIWHGMEIPVWLVPVICLIVPPPNLLCIPQSLWGVDTEWDTEKALMLCRHCSARAKTFVCYQHCFGHKEHSTMPAATKKINSIPVRLSTMRNLQKNWCFLHRKHAGFWNGTECLFVGEISLWSPTVKSRPAGPTHLLVLLIDLI